jgi:hypothetical protein
MEIIHSKSSRLVGQLFVIKKCESGEPIIH